MTSPLSTTPFSKRSRQPESSPMEEAISASPRPKRRQKTEGLFGAQAPPAPVGSEASPQSIQNMSDMQHLIDTPLPNLLIIFAEKIARLLAENLMTKEILGLRVQGGEYEGFTVLALIIRLPNGRNGPLFFQDLLGKKLITKELLAACPDKGPQEGINCVRLIIQLGKLDFFQSLLAVDLIDEPILATTPKEGPSQGKNSLWLITMQITPQKKNILNTLLEKRLITPRLLAACPNQDKKKLGINAVWLLLAQKEWGIFRVMLNQRLITEDLLAKCRPQGNYAGINALMIIAMHGAWDVFEELRVGELVTSKLLAEKGTQKNSAGVNTVFTIINAKAWNVFLALLKAELLTPEMLSAGPPGGPDTGPTNSYQQIALKAPEHVQKALSNSNLLESILEIARGA